MKVKQYEELLSAISTGLTGQCDSQAKMAYIVNCIKEQMNFFWVGFYVVHDDELRLGAYAGPSACERIKYGRGVCGTAWKEAKTQIVPDVNQFPGHIACSSLSCSEIVVPVWTNGTMSAVLDIDSTEYATFDETDRLYLEKIVQMLS